MIIIIGASKGIGKYLFDEFESKGYSVIGTYNTTISENKKLSKVNVTNYDEIYNWIDREKESLKNITLINCAGISYNSFTHKSDPLKWKEVIDINLIGSYNTIRAILPLMREQKYGRIINFSSVLAKKSTPGVSAYAASKAALSGMIKSIAQENASLNITINNINMGYSELGMIKQVPNQFLKNIIEQIPNKRLCEPLDIFKTVKYLIDCSYITGSSVDINGGLI